MKEHATSHSSVAVRLFEWWHEARDRWARLHDIDRWGADEIAQVADDVGLPDVELLRVAREANGTPELLARRLRALNLDPEEIRALSPLLLADLKRTCANCTEKQRCADDMAENPNPPGWESYCPNAGTLRTLT